MDWSGVVVVVVAVVAIVVILVMDRSGRVRNDVACVVKHHPIICTSFHYMDTVREDDERRMGEGRKEDGSRTKR
eukprot:6634605-Pyramimonas_sp.AAC.1